MCINAELLTTLTAFGLEKSPVAVGFFQSPPPGLSRVAQPDAAGCGYWKLASEGHSFYTTADDHLNCSVGAFTHGVDLSPESSQELQSLLGTMIELQYLSGDEISSIPHRTTPMQVAAYAPLAKATFPPDVVIVRGNVRQIMLLSEAARAAGVFETGAIMGRPACAMLPAAIASSTSVASVGCIGNRVYTGLGDDELYLTVPGDRAGVVFEKLESIFNANRELEKFHRQRAKTLG